MAATISSILQYFQSFIPGQRLVDGGDLKNLVDFIFSSSVPTTRTALAGGGAPGAPTMSLYFNRIDVVATNNDSAIINRPAVPGTSLYVDNMGASTLAIFPMQSNINNGNAADQIIPHASVTPGASTTQATGIVGFYFCDKLGFWKQMLSA